MIGQAFEIAALALAGGAALSLGWRLVTAWRRERAQAQATQSQATPDEPAPPPEQPSDPTYPALALGLLLLLLALGIEVVYRPPSTVTPLMWAGRVLVVAAAGLTIGSRQIMGASYAATAHHPDPERQVLITRGPYRFLRHPQYVGNWASLVGLVLALDLRWTWLALLPMSAALLWRIRREEDFLTERFGPEWRTGG